MIELAAFLLIIFILFGRSAAQTVFTLILVASVLGFLALMALFAHAEPHTPVLMIELERGR